MSAFRSAAPAKLNLYLHVLGRRPDGYHELDSLIVFAGVADTLSAAPSADLRLDIDGPFAAPLRADADNLVLRAARKLAAAAGIDAGARLRLTKRLPVASGIGGGSADAAAALRVLSALWGLDLADDRLPSIAAGLGADVPVCVAGTPSFVFGVGEVIRPAPPLPPASVVLVNPGTPVPTGRVFAGLHAFRDAGAASPRLAAAAGHDLAALVAALSDTGNDLAVPARAIAPAIDDVLAALAARPGCLMSRLSGSGATCFGLFAAAEAARHAAAALRRDRPDWWVAEGPLLDEPPKVETDPAG